MSSLVHRVAPEQVPIEMIEGCLITPEQVVPLISKYMLWATGRFRCRSLGQLLETKESSGGRTKTQIADRRSCAKRLKGQQQHWKRKNIINKLQSSGPIVAINIGATDRQHVEIEGEVKIKI